MGMGNKIFSVIVSASTANFTAHTYSQIYSVINSAPTVNGVVINMVAGTLLTMNINSVTGSTTGVFLLGDKVNVATDSQNLGGAQQYSMPTALENLLLNMYRENQSQYFDGIYLFTNTGQTASLTNIMSSSFSGSVIDSPSWTVLGWSGDTINDAIDFNVNFSATTGLKYSLNNCHISVYSRENKIQAAIELGSFDGTQGSWIAQQYSSGSSFVRLNSNNSATYTGITDTRGWWYLEKSGSTQVQLFIEGATRGFQTNTTTALPNKNFYGLSSSNSPSGVLLPSAKRLAIITFGKAGVNTTVMNRLFDNYLNDIGYPVRTVWGLGDSFMYGFNASTQANSFFNIVGTARNWDFINSGTSGQALFTGGTQVSFSVNLIPTKTRYDYKIVVDWLLNDAYNTYYSGITAHTTVVQYTGAVQNFINTVVNKGWAKSDIFWITGWQVSAENQYYSQAQLNILTAALRGVLDTNGVPYTRDFTAYGLSADGVHPLNDAAYLNIANQILTQI